MPSPSRAESPGLSPAPSVPPRTPEVDQPIVDVGLLRDYIGFGLHALGRHWLAAAFTFLAILGAGGLALVILPRNYSAETKLLAQRNIVMPVLSNPQRRLPSESDTPTRQASEVIINHANLESIVKTTDLARQWREHRAPLTRARDFISERLSHPPTMEEQVGALVWLLSRRLRVVTADGTVTISIYWPDGDMAYRILNTAQENFVEQRHTEELALISESIGILEQHATEVHDGIRSTLDSMAKERKQIVPAEQTPLTAVFRRAAPPSREALAVQSRMAVVQRTIADLEQFRNRRLAELQASLADQRNTYGPAHPQIESTQQLIRGLMTDSPQLVQLRREELELRNQLATLGAEATPAAPSNADPVLAAAAIRSLDRLRVDSLLGEKQQYERARLRISIREYEDLLDRLEGARIELQTARAAFKYRYGVLMPPEVPQSPTSPKPVIVVMGSLMLGVCLAFSVSVALDLLGGRVLERWQVERQLGLPVLGDAPLH